MQTTVNSALDTDSHYPLFCQLADILQEKIQSGEYLPGTRLPSEPDLAQCYKVSRFTVRSAINLLIQLGLVYAMRGKGTVIAREIHKCAACGQIIKQSQYTQEEGQRP